MSTSVGDLSVNVSADIASLYTGMQQAADIVSRSAKEMAGQFSDLDDRIGGVVSSLKTLGEAAILGFSIKGLADMVTGSIEAQASLQDLAVKVGTTASELSALIPAAKLSGTGLDEVAQASGRFSKNLASIGDGTNAAGKALQALGFNATDAGRLLANPTQGLVELAKHMNEFADDGTKTAAAIALLGKGAQQLLPFLKQLGDEAQVQALYSDQQVKAAHDLEDQWRTLQLAGDQLKATIAASLVPALSDLIKAFTATGAGADGLRGTLKGFAEDDSFTKWALKIAIGGAVIGESLVAIGQAFYAFGSSVRVVGDDIETLYAIFKVGAASFLGGDALKQANDELNTMLAKRNADLVSANKAWAAAWGSNKTALSTALEDEFAKITSFNGKFAAAMAAQATLPLNADSTDRRLFGNAAQAPGKKPSSGFSGAATGGIDQAAQALLEFQKQAAAASAELDDLFSGTKITQAEKYLAGLKANAAVWDTFNAKTKEAIEIAAQIASWREQDVQKIKDQQAAIAKLTIEQEKYSAAQVAATKAVSGADATSQLLGLTQQEDAIKRQYDRGVIDFQHYYDQLMAVQKQGIDVQAQNEQVAIDQQQALVSGIQAQIAALDPAKFASYNDFLNTVYALYNKLIPANAALTVAQDHLNDTISKGTEAGKDNVEQLHQVNAAYEASVKSINDQIAQQTQANLVIGLSASQTHLFIAAQLQEAAAYETLHNGSQERINDLLAQADAQRKLAETLFTGEQLTKSLDAWKSTLQSAADEGATFIENFVTHGSSAFQTLWSDFKTWALKAFAEIAAQQIIISLAPSFGTTAANAANQLFGQGGSSVNQIMQLLTGGKGIPGTGGLVNSFETSSVGQAIGLSAPSGILATGAGEEAAASIPAALETTLTGAGTFLAAAAPFLPILGLAIPLISGLFSSKPSEVKGQFQVSPTTTGFEDNAFTSSSFGNLGFNDANTQQFSGDAAQVLNKVIAGALDAFQQRFSPEQSSRLATILQGTTFASESGTFTTQDFLQKYGGQVLQQVVTAAFNVLDPALGSVAAAFHGTADEVSTFSNSLLGIFDATKQIGNIDFTSKVDAALSDATQATADKVLAFVTIVSQFGDSISGLGPKLEALNPAQMTAFIDALGGAQAALTQMTYLQANFTTSADKANAAQALLNTDFANLGLTVPATHQAFLNLLNSFTDGSDASNKMYASILALAPLFVQVAGTADQAAQALNQLANTGLAYYQQHFLTPAEQLQNRQTVDETQLQTASAAGTTLNAVLTHFGLDIIPSTVQGVRDLVSETIALYGANSDQAKAIEAVIPILGDLIDSVGGFGTAATNAAAAVNAATNSMTVSVGSLISQADGMATTLLSNISSLAGNSTGDFGAKLSIQIGLINSAIKNAQADTSQFGSDTAFAAYVNTLKGSDADLTTQLAEFNRLSALYDASRAEQLVNLEIWRNQQDAIFQGFPDDLAAVNTLFQQRWDAIVAGVSSGVSGALDQMARLQQGIADYLKGLQVGSLSPLTPNQQLNAAQNAFLDDLAKAQPSNTDTASRQAALGDITQLADAFLKQAQSFDPSNYLNVFNEVTKDLAPLAGTGPNGLPLPTTMSATVAIASALPTDSKLASSADVAASTAATKTLQTTMQQLLTAIANAATKDAQLQTAATLTAANLLVASTPQR